MIGRRRTRSPSAAETRSMSPPPRAVDGAYDAVDDNGSACDGAPSTTGRKAAHTELPIDVALECALLALAAEISECSNESSNAVTLFTARFTRPFDDAARALIARCRAGWAGMLQQCRSSGSSDCSEQRLRLMILTLAQVSANVRAGQKTTLRDLYYCLAESAEHRQTATNDAILRLAQMLERPRHELLVCASTKGLLNGTLRWNGLSPAQTGSLPIPGELACLQDFCRCYLSAGPKERTVWAAAASADLAAASASVDIDGPGVDPVAVVAYADYVHYCKTTAAQQPDAPHSRGFVSLPTQIRLSAGTRAVLIVEKEAVFQRLVDSRAWAHAPFVLLTGRGMPDVATRCVVKLLALLFPRLPFVGLVDCNPSGVVILAQYRFGGLHAARSAKGAAAGSAGHYLAVEQLQWLGLRPSHIERLKISGTVGSAHTPRDRRLIESLCALHGSEGDDPNSGAVAASLNKWRIELQRMGAPGQLKYDIEAVYSAAARRGSDADGLERDSDLAAFVTTAVLCRDCI
jgi:hypothetical protein